MSDWRARWTATVDASAESARLRFITPGAGQQAVYLLKREEARDFLALDAPAQAAAMPDDWPMLAAERPAGPPDTLAARAAVIMTMADMWTAAAAAIETLRLAAKAEITAAVSEADARAAAETAMRSWPVGPG